MDCQVVEPNIKIISPGSTNHLLGNSKTDVVSEKLAAKFAAKLAVWGGLQTANVAANLAANFFETTSVFEFPST